MNVTKTPLAVMFGNRGFFPADLIARARDEVLSTLQSLGHKTLTLPADATHAGGIETPAEGEKFANFLAAHRGEFGGVILSLPNFGDENGAIAALRDAGVPILIQAYPDDLNKMAPELRRDSFCGKFSIMDVFCQNDLPFTVLKPHTVHPTSEAFKRNVDHFDRLCRVAGGMKRLTVGAIGARTTPFKTVRIDEVALQKHGITVETVDLSDVFKRMEGYDAGSDKLKSKAETMKGIASWDGVPDKAFDNVTRLAVAIDELIDEMSLDACAIRCWTEMQTQYGVSPCVILGELNDRGIPAACEVDLGNAVMMTALHLASGDPPTLLDWNNNYADELDKCILFHCGPVPKSLMAAKGHIVDHEILAQAVGKGCGFGCNAGRIAPMPFTFGSLLTNEGRMEFYLGEAKFTDDPIPDDYFGCAAVAEFDGLQDLLQTIGYLGHRHHVAVTRGHVAEAIREAFEDYLDYDVTTV
jgi:L-fucose isomerase-like protein